LHQGQRLPPIKPARKPDYANTGRLGGSSRFHMGTGDKLDQSATKALSAGSVAIMQPKIHHFAWTNDETIVQVHGVGPWAITYVNPADDPRK
jgi:hypothetical protein